ncbi:MAG TPA: Gldg family protein [Gemmataceae bacterium]|nr:Gldg family protein [Gemmataceae bacterium]
MSNVSNNFGQVDSTHNKQTAYALMVAGLLFAVIPLWLGIKYRTEYLPICFWGGSLALVAFGAGIWQLLDAMPRDLAPADAKRLLVLVIGGLSGVATAVFLGLGLTSKWWNDVAGGWETWQGRDGWHVWVCLLSTVAGLAIMFISLQLARGDEKSGSGYRRFLYAYNTILTSCLLLLLLLVVNVLVYIPWGPFAFFNNTYYWAESSIYSLSSQSERILQGLDKPLKVYVIIPENNPVDHLVHVLLDNFRSVQPNIQVKYLSPDLDKEEVGRLGKEYKFSAERSGVLLVYGSEPKTEHRFVKDADLVSRGSEMTSRSSQGMFKGESALITELNSMAEGKEKPVVYFTQGNGELDINDRQVTQRDDEGCGLYRDQMESKGVKVQGLLLSPVEGLKSKSPDTVVSTKVPDDASVVVIAGPRKRFEEHALTALRNYMEPTDPTKKKGKLVVLLDPVLAGEDRAEMTGLEDLLADFKIEVGKNRVLELANGYVRSFEIILAGVQGDQMARAQNPFIDTFAKRGYLLLRARTIQPRAGGVAGNERYRTEVLLATQPNDEAWAETNLQSDVNTLVRELDARGELNKIISPDPLSVGVIVTEPSPGSASDPHSFMQSEEKPRMIVIGSSASLRNSLSRANLFRSFYDFFASGISWLRERPSNIGIEAKNRDLYVLNPSANFSRMIWLPALLMVVGVIGLGTGVWVVRRR